MSNDDSRVPVITSRDQVPSDLQHHYDSIEASRGGVRGPFSVLMNSPEVAGRIGHLGAYIRFESEIPDAERELAIITAAREFDCAYEWAAHEPIARDAGVREEAIDAVANRSSLEGLTDEEMAIVQYGRDLFREHEISDELFATIHERFGDTGSIELTATFGYYGMLACVLNACEVMPDPERDTLPN